MHAGPHLSRDPATRGNCLDAVGELACEASTAVVALDAPGLLEGLVLWSLEVDLLPQYLYAHLARLVCPAERQMTITIMDACNPRFYSLSVGE